MSSSTQLITRVSHAGHANGLQCATCGATLVEAASANSNSNSRDAEGGEEEESEAEKIKPKPKTKPSQLRFKKVRHATRVDMMCRIPGIGRAIATVVLEKFQTFRSIQQIDKRTLSALKVGDRRLGDELATAIMRTLA